MKKALILLCVVIILPLAYWLISPLFYDTRVGETLDDALTKVSTEEDVQSGPVVTTLSSGEFQGLAGHNGKGRVTLLEIEGKKILRFEDDFSVTNGPDLFVHFGNDGVYEKEANLGELKGSIGGKNYEIPATIDISTYNEVWVWCRAFSVPFAKAILH